MAMVGSAETLVQAFESYLLAFIGLAIYQAAADPGQPTNEIQEQMLHQVAEIRIRLVMELERVLGGVKGKS